MTYQAGDGQENKLSRYSLVIAVAKRAKQLRDGALKQIDTKSRNPITIALEEINSGKVRVVTPTQEDLEAAARAQVAPARPGPRNTADLLRVTDVDEVDFDEALKDHYEAAGDEDLEEAGLDADLDETGIFNTVDDIFSDDEIEEIPYEGENENSEDMEE